ncbi:HAMP domain-containing histidine kinase [bacterium]|nr:HAMP domain-containing histidine kinase [bacterium]
MRIVPRVNVRVSLTMAILLTIVLSWVISAGITNYSNYLNIRSFQQEMVKHPELYPRPMPEPKFGWMEFLSGRTPFPPRHERHLPPNPKIMDNFKPPTEREPIRKPPRDSFIPFDLKWSFIRLGVALGLAVLAGAWLGRRFTRPLSQLTKGAEAFQSGDFNYRISVSGKSEFSEVAESMNDMARQVSDQINRLEKDAERRRQFLADIAHEFRSPVTTMRTMAGALSDGVADDPERKERAISALEDTSERLLRLVRDLMELAKIDLDEFPLNVREVEIRELAASVIHSHNPEAVQAGVIIQPLTEGNPIIAEIDPDRITQVLDNIIDNAISYAGEGSRVDMTLEDGEQIKIVIKDTGKGIRREDIGSVLEPFYRADAARTPGDCHSGLGLSIASRLVEAHGGILSIVSEECKGTTVTIVIPKR